MQKKLRVYGCLTLTTTILVITTFLTLGVVFPPDIHVLEEEMAITDHLWSSDGTKIAYVKSPNVGNNQLGNCEIWVAEWNHPAKVSPYSQRSAISSYIKKHTMIFSGPECYAYSLEDWRDGWILFQRDEPGLVQRTLWKIRDDGSELIKIARIRAAYYGRFIPGTDLVYFSGHPGGGWWRPQVCKADGSWGRYYLSNNEDLNSFTTGMSPTGNKLIFGDSWYWDADTDMYSCNVDGSDLVLMGKFLYRTTPLALGDGNTVLYHYIRTKNIGEPPPAVAGNIYAMNMDGNNKRKVIDDEYMNYWANYNPVDPQAFLMRSNRGEDGNYHIFAINADGTGITQLTEGPYNDYNPMYSPDGQYLMYLRLPEDYVPDPDFQPWPFELVIARFLGKQWWRIA